MIWVPGSQEPGILMWFRILRNPESSCGSGFPGTRNPHVALGSRESVATLCKKAVKGYVTSPLCLKMHKNELWNESGFLWNGTMTPLIPRSIIPSSDNKQIFPVTSGRFPSKRARSWLEVTKKIRRHSGLEYCVQVSSMFEFFLPKSARTPSPGIIMSPMSGTYYH